MVKVNILTSLGTANYNFNNDNEANDFMRAFKTKFKDEVISMKKTNINGKEIREPKFCKTCQDGKIFENENLTRTLKFANTSEERICGVCGTKYYLARKDAKILIGKDCKVCNNKCYDFDLNFLCECNISDMSLRIVRELDEVVKMDKGNENRVKIDQEIFGKTGTCPGHIWYDSKVVRFFDGEVTFKVCPICQMARVTIDGKTYEDRLMKLVTWVADRAIKKEEGAKKAEKLFKKISGVKADNLPCLETQEFQYYPIVSFKK